MIVEKDFKAVAKIIKNNCDGGLDDTLVKIVAEELADYFTEQNPNFNRERFIEACGL